METLFLETLSTDKQLRKRAAKELRRLESTNYSKYVTDIYQLLLSENTKDNVRLSAGIALKNSLSRASWSLENIKTKNVMKLNIISLLDTKKRNVANVVSQVVAAIAVIELPLNHWKDLINILLNNVTNPYSTDDLKQSTLQTIGYICESLDPKTLSIDQCNAILTAIIEGARREQKNPDIRLAAIKALYNSLEFTRRNFENSIERDYIMKVVCDGATQNINSSIDLQVSSYECLNRIMQLYYDKMDDYMSSSLFNLTVYGMIRSDPRITLQAIEFWCTVCETEISLTDHKSSMYSFSDQTVTYILPSLFILLVKDNTDEYEQDVDDEWNISNAASHCLSLFALCCKELVVPQTIEFIANNLFASNNVWNQKEAAIIAFGCIIQGPCKYKTEQLVNQIMPVILSSMNDPVIYIRTAASWTLAQIIRESIKVLKVDMVLHDMIPIIIEGLYAVQQKIVYNSCLCFIYLSEELKAQKSNPDEAIVTSGPLSAYTKSILSALLKITQTTKTKYDAKCRNTIYETIGSVITHSTQDCIGSVTTITDCILNRLEKVNTLAKMKTYNYDDFWTLQTSLLGVITSCVYRLSKEATSFSDRIMVIVFEITQLNLTSQQDDTHITVVEDAFLLVSALINSTGFTFLRHVDTFLPNLSKTLGQQQLPPEVESNRLSVISVGIISDISCTFGESIFPYAGEFMKLLLNNLKSETLHREVKPVTLSCIGDIAQALGPLFRPFVDIVMMALKQAGNMQSDKKDQSMVDYVDAIRVGTLEAFVGVIQGLSQNAATREFLIPFVTDIIFFLNNIAMDQARSDRLTRAMFGVLGDIARIYGRRIKCSLIESPLNHLIIENSKGNLYFSKGTREMARWAQQTVTAVYYKQ